MQCKQTPRADLVADALEHYDALTVGAEWKSLIPEAIRLWGTDPEQRIRNLEAALAQAERERDEEHTAREHAADIWQNCVRNKAAAIARAEQAESRACDPNTCSYLADVKEELDALAEAKAAAEAAGATMRSVLLSIAGNAHVMTTIYDTLGPPYYAIGIALETGAGAPTLAELERLRAIEMAAKECYPLDGVYMGETVTVPEAEYRRLRAALAAPQAGGGKKPRVSDERMIRVSSCIECPYYRNDSEACEDQCTTERHIHWEGCRQSALLSNDGVGIERDCPLERAPRAGGEEQ
jgi:hypothetical protein